MSCNIINFECIVIITNHTNKRFWSKFDILKRKEFHINFDSVFKNCSKNPNSNSQQQSNILTPKATSSTRFFCKQTDIGLKFSNLF